MITRTHNGYHLGDNLVHLHFLRKVALANPDRQFIHAAQWQYLKQLQDLVLDVPNLSLTDYNYLPPADSINAWRGDKQFWYSHPDRNDFVKFHVESWFPYLADRMKVENPVRKREDMLFDYPALLRRKVGELYPACDVLVINSAPGSGQVGYDQFALAMMADAISAKGFSVVVTDIYPENLVSTQRLGFNITQIGHLSLSCHAIFMVSTGPSWPTFNIWNQDTVMNRIVLLDSERIWLSPHTIHCRNVGEASEVLKEAGLL